jgi:hydroxybutyrate-dimer hydrolase
VAVKHAHSQVNTEKDWGRHTLAAIEFAFHVLNGLTDRRRRALRAENTLVIASSISNGAYAALAAAEQDTRGLIDGLASVRAERVARGRALDAGHLDAAQRLPPLRIARRLQPRRALQPGTAAAARGALRLAGEKGLLRSSTLAQQAAESQRIINEYGILPDANLVLPSHYNLSVMQGIAVTYANSYGRFSVLDNLCGYSFAASTSSGVDAGNPADGRKPGELRSPSPTASRRPRESTSSTTCRPEGRRKSGCRPRPRPARATLTSTAPCACARSPPASTRSALGRSKASWPSNRAACGVASRKPA